MAEVDLDTPVYAYGLRAASPVQLFTGPLPQLYARLSPSSTLPAAAVARWWATVPETVVPLQASPRARPGGPAADGAARSRFLSPTGTWLLPEGALREPTGGIASGQSAVNAGHVDRLTAALRAAGGVPPWPPVHLVLLGGVAWLADGVHRACAGLTCLLPALPVRCVDAATETSCPCGWRGTGGDLLTHPCPA